jgi:hypothetical protein
VSHYERTGERDPWPSEWVSRWHRRLGHRCPMVDLDWPCIEWDYGRVLWYVEWKRCSAPEFDLLSDQNLQALAAAANRHDPAKSELPLPFIVVRYWPHPSSPTFKVTPGNPAARDFFMPGELLTEYEFSAALFRIRHWACPEKRDVLVADFLKIRSELSTTLCLDAFPSDLSIWSKTA